MLFSSLVKTVCHVNTHSPMRLYVQYLCCVVVVFFSRKLFLASSFIDVDDGLMKRVFSRCLDENTHRPVLSIFDQMRVHGFMVFKFTPDMCKSSFTANIHGSNGIWFISPFFCHPVKEDRHNHSNVYHIHCHILC